MKRRGWAAVAALAAVGALVWVWRLGGGADPVELRAATATYQVRLSLDGPRVGPNDVRLEVTDAAGGPVVAEEVTVEPVMPHMGHASPPVTAASEGPGRYRAGGAELPMAGPWELGVTIRAAGGAERAVFDLLVQG